MAMFYGLMVLCLAGSALAQVFRGGCPQVESMQNFNISGILGTWHVAERVFHNFEWPTVCNDVSYTLDDNDTIKCVNSYVNTLTGEPGAVHADIYMPDRARPQEMLVYMPLAPEGTMSNCWVLGTDYDNYLIVWSCTEYPRFNLSTVYSWLVSRTRIIQESARNDAYNVLKQNNIDRSMYYKVEQEGCDAE